MLYTECMTYGIRGMAAHVLLIACMLAMVLMPTVAMAFPFGGQASIVRPCFNEVIYVSLGPPRGGPYIWSQNTKTYLYGPPRHAGQWLLGLASITHYCLVSRRPVISWPGSLITMMGSSQ